MWTELLIVGRRQFFEQLGDKYVMDLQEFLHDKLPKLLIVALISWVLMWVLRLVTGRILKIAKLRHEWFEYLDDPAALVAEANRARPRSVR